MDNDLLMLRGEVEGGFNLAPGEPVFLQNILHFIYDRIGFPVKNDLKYPPYMGHELLVNNLKRYWKSIGLDYNYFVITNGAKQAISAAIYALKGAQNKGFVWHKAPYWPSFRTLAELQGMSFYDSNTDKYKENPRRITINTCPNNPDGRQDLDGCDIWDAVYANAIYQWSYDQVPKHQIMVSSMSKLFGYPGLRLGWAATNDKTLAFFMGNYIEKATSGVANICQYKAADILDAALTYDSVFKDYVEAEFILHDNTALVDFYLGNVIEINVKTTGIFAWFKVKDPYHFSNALTRSGVKLIPGESCGMIETGWYRMNIGVETRYLEAALIKLKGELENVGKGIA